MLDMGKENLLNFRIEKVIISTFKLFLQKGIKDVKHLKSIRIDVNKSFMFYFILFYLMKGFVIILIRIFLNFLDVFLRRTVGG